MDERTCPQCNVDVELAELRLNSLRCPICGCDFSEVPDPYDVAGTEDTP